MNTIFNLGGLILTCALVMNSSIAVEGGKGVNTLKIGLFKDCQLVKEAKLNEPQRQAYLQLKQQELVMHELEKPIKQIEAKIAEFSAKIDQLTALAIQETQTSLHIDKKYLHQQEVVAEQFDDFMSAHQADFAALAEHGRKVSKFAQRFEQSIAPLFESIEHDSVQIIDSEQGNTHNNCHNGINVMS